MKKKVIVLLLTFAMVFIVAGCSSKDNNEGASESVVVIAMGSGFSTLDPGFMYEQNPTLVANACYETLFKFIDGSDEPQTSLAESYTFSDDGLALTIVLKEEATFASGNPVTSEDVKFSLNRTKNLKGNPSFIADTIKSIECPDESTVVINLTGQDSAILSKLGYASCSILDSKVVKENGGTDAEDANTTDTAQVYLDATSAGSGMYVLKSYTPDEEIILEKNENYWGTTTNVDKYIIKLQGDANTQMMGLSSGDIDIALNLTDDTIIELEGKENVKVQNESTKTVGFLMMNEDEKIGGPVANNKVQKAISYAIDYKGIQTICGTGSITPESIIQVGFMGSKGEKDVSTATDLVKAKELLKEAGYEDGFDIDLEMSELDMEGVPLLDLAQIVKEDLSEININVNIVQRDWVAGYGDDYRDGKMGMTIIYWGIDYNDPNVQLVFLPGQQVGLRANWKEKGYEDITKKYNDILAETDSSKRSQLLVEVQDMIEEDSPFVMLAQASCHIGYNSKLTGVNFSDTYRVDVTEINIQ
ncbi:ABC transporter substrate-binding protein [Alkalibaculum sp. M08DMB]|uniref:ABC transporter substrate-binding protein n=1 Tax=Alkalibaculum sporogenes TaxID=2655001 RepID=A0A6A7K9B7_9FIRM|nr:ABC transporter substrate-binding protein [Alkalibaculum sporogenes]MPW25986.1 ABC transporter substrate-binding protein [Alkalibaculum sporogenes]